MLFTQDIGIDLGTANTLVFVLIISYFSPRGP